MLADEIELLHECFDVVEDPRVVGRSDQPLDSVLFVIVTAVIAGADGPSDIQAYALEQQDWIEQYVDLPVGVPSHDTIGRILAAIKPDQFQAALLGQRPDENYRRNGAKLARSIGSGAEVDLQNSQVLCLS